MKQTSCARPHPQGVNLDDRVVEQLVSASDTNNNGAIEFEELQHHLQAHWERQGVALTLTALETSQPAVRSVAL